MEALQHAIAAACLDAGAGEAIAEDLRGFLERFGVSSDDVEAILAAPRRLHVYRSLVRNGLSGIILRVLPRTRTRMNATCAGRFDADFAAFVEEAGARTHYLRDVPAELVAWAAPRWRLDPTVPAYLADLAEHEVLDFAVAAAEGAERVPSGRVQPEAGAEITLDRALAFDGSARVVRRAWAVHELPGSAADLTEPARRDVFLLVYRDPAHSVRWLALTPVAFAIVERLLAGEPLGRAVEDACEAHAVTAASLLRDIARLLADLGERGVVLGAR